MKTATIHAGDSTFPAIPNDVDTAARDGRLWQLYVAAVQGLCADPRSSVPVQIVARGALEMARAAIEVWESRGSGEGPGGGAA